MPLNCSSLKYRIAVIFTCIVGGVMVTSLWLELRETIASHNAQLEAKEKVYAEFLGEVSRNALISGEFEVLQLHIRQLLQDPQIIFIAIADGRERVVAATNPTFIGKPLSVPSFEDGDHWAITDITNPTGRVGRIAFIFSHASARQAYRQQRQYFLISVAVSLIAVVASSLLAGTLLTRRLKRVADAATQFGEGNWQVRIADTGQDEIAQLAHSFNGMAERLDGVMGQLQHQANFDSLTDLPNRLLLYDRITQAVQQARRSSTQVAILLLDLDNFKSINDTFGHSAGDLLLVEVGKRISAIIRGSDTLARLGGDEFVILSVGIHHAQDAAKICRQVIAALTPSFMIGQAESFITTSIGVTLYPSDGDTPETLLKNADIAMYHAKRTGKNSFQFFTDEIQCLVQDRLVLENRLRKALERDEYQVFYQPQVDVVAGKVTGAEALLRWQPAGEEMVLPGRFIPILEDTGMIIPVGEWILAAVCRQLVAWKSTGLELSVSVNVSIKQFQSPNIVNRICAIVAEHGCTPRQICLELTESIILDHTTDMLGKLQQLKEQGFRFSIDDFGTGYSSLSYLKRLPITEIKIDREFIKGLPDDTHDVAIVNTIVSIARHMGMSVIAEGVETAAQADSLVAMGCPRIQGFYFGRPVTPKELVEQLTREAAEHGST